MSEEIVKLEKEVKKLKKTLAGLAEWELKIDSLNKDLNRIVMMYWHDERNHWDSIDNPEDHIFHSINNIKNYLIGIKK